MLVVVEAQHFIMLQEVLEDTEAEAKEEMTLIVLQAME